jgi:hypothetical protein
MTNSDCKTVLRQLTAHAIDARDILSAAADNPVFEPEDRDILDAIIHGLDKSLKAGGTWLKQANAPTIEVGGLVLVSFNSDLIPCVLERFIDNGRVAVRDEYHGDLYTVDVDQIKPYQE